MSEYSILIKEASLLIKGLKFTNSPRNTSTVALMDLCYEHASSISMLLEHGKFGSALGLYRSCVEAYIRGAWLFNCASDAQISEKIETKKNWSPLSSLVTELAKKDEEFLFLNRYVKGHFKSTLDSLTHGMSMQILNRFNGETIKFVITPEEREYVHKEVCFFSLLAHAFIAEVAKDEKLEFKVIELFERM